MRKYYVSRDPQTFWVLPQKQNKRGKNFGVLLLREVVLHRFSNSHRFIVFSSLWEIKNLALFDSQKNNNFNMIFGCGLFFLLLVNVDVSQCSGKPLKPKLFSIIIVLKNVWISGLQNTAEYYWPNRLESSEESKSNPLSARSLGLKSIFLNLDLFYQNKYYQNKMSICHFVYWIHLIVFSIIDFYCNGSQTRSFGDS